MAVVVVAAVLAASVGAAPSTPIVGPPLFRTPIRLEVGWVAEATYRMWAAGVEPRHVAAAAR